MTRREYNGAWPALSKQILKRDGYQCQIQGPRCKGVAVETDHIIPIEEGGARLDSDNLRAVCRPCHNGRKARKLVIVTPADTEPSRTW